MCTSLWHMFVCDAGCDILQPDITWCGGITEARRIYALASAYDIPCIPHGSSVYSYHLQFASAQSPLAELLIMSKKEEGWCLSFLLFWGCVV